MLKIRSLLISLLTIYLSSCASLKTEMPKIAPQQRCIVVFTSKQYIDGIDYRTGYCRCHLYEWDESHIGRITESVDYSLDRCDKLIGFEPDSYAAVWSWWENLRLWSNRNK